MITLDDIAKKVGISKSTVSKALNHASDISEYPVHSGISHHIANC